MTRTYVRIRSWHLLAEGVEDDALTRCGRKASALAPVADELPLDERSCETCLRLAAHDEEDEGDE